MNRRTQKFFRFLVLLCVLLFGPGVVQDLAAQEFEPRTYSVAPVGLNFFAIGYAYATGAVFMDPGLPADDVDGKVHAVMMRYVRTLNLFGKPAKAKVVLPWTSGHWDGFYEGEFRIRDTDGFGDVRFVIESQFSGAQVLTPAQMASFEPMTVWGARLQVVAPTGHYDPDRVINIGANRWTFIPEIGFGHPVGKWSIEGALAAWVFTDNDDYAGGHTHEQDPLLVAKVHAIRNVRPGFWWAMALGYGYGGKTFVDGEKRATIQRNWRFSLVLAYPLSKTQGISASLISGGNAGAGAEKHAVAVGYQVAW